MAHARGVLAVIRFGSRLADWSLRELGKGVSICLLKESPMDFRNILDEFLIIGKISY